MQQRATIADICAVMEQWYPSSTAEKWDKNGLILGDPGQSVRRVLLAVDPVSQVADQAIASKTDVILTHHPLFLRGTSFLPENTPKGRLCARLIRHNIGLLNAHTNADCAHDGVAQALAELVGVENTEPLVSAGVDTQGRAIGLGRIGTIAPMSLRDFARQVAQVLPAGPTGLLIGGDMDAEVRRIAVSGGSGDSFLEDARRHGADVFLTADLRHHPASEHLEGGRPFLLCASHWASEWPWLMTLEKKLTRWAHDENMDLEVEVSTIETEPWTAHLQTTGEYA